MIPDQESLFLEASSLEELYVGAFPIETIVSHLPLSREEKQELLRTHPQPGIQFSNRNITDSQIYKKGDIQEYFYDRGLEILNNLIPELLAFKIMGYDRNCSEDSRREVSKLVLEERIDEYLFDELVRAYLLGDLKSLNNFLVEQRRVDLEIFAKRIGMEIPYKNYSLNKYPGFCDFNKGVINISRSNEGGINERAFWSSVGILIYISSLSLLWNHQNPENIRNAAIVFSGICGPFAGVMTAKLFSDQYNYANSARKILDLENFAYVYSILKYLSYNKETKRLGLLKNVHIVDRKKKKKL